MLGADRGVGVLWRAERPAAPYRKLWIERWQRWRTAKRPNRRNKWPCICVGGPVMRWVFLAIAVWGAIHPMYYFITWFNTDGYDLMAMVDAWHANAASSGLVWDLTIAAVALTVWILFEVIQRRIWLGLIAIPATFGIGVSCGLPLYLFLRMRNDT